MELFGVLLIVGGTLIVLRCLGLLGSSSADAEVVKMGRELLNNNKGLSPGHVDLRTSTGAQMGVSFPIKEYDAPERYSSMDDDALASEIRRMGDEGRGKGPGDGHPG